MSDETLQQVFTVSAPAKLRLGNIAGSVDIQPGESGVISVTAVKRAGKGDAEHTEVVMRQESDGAVVVETRWREGGWFFFHMRPCNVDYTVRVPAACELDLDGVSNSASVQGLEGSLNCHTVSGNVSLEALKGSFKINSVSGDVCGQQLSGPLRLETVSGDVRLLDSQFDELKANTVSGNIILQTGLNAGPYRFETVSGDIRLTVPPDTRCSAELSTLSGHIATNLPSVTHRSNGFRRAEIQGGGVRIKSHSVSGDVYVNSSEPIQPPAPPVAPAPAMPDVPAQSQPVSRIEVLEGIERGEITVEEGLRLL